MRSVEQAKWESQKSALKKGAVGLSASVAGAEGISPKTIIDDPNGDSGGMVVVADCFQV